MHRWLGAIVVTALVFAGAFFGAKGLMGKLAWTGAALVSGILAFKEWTGK